MLGGVCVLQIDNSPPGSDWNLAASTCAGFGGDLCSPTQYAVIIPFNIDAECIDLRADFTV